MSDEQLRRLLGARIREFRERSGMSQAQLATAAGITVDAIQNWEQGRRTPAALTIPALAQALGVTADDLLAISTETPPPESPPAPRGRPRKPPADAPAPEVSPGPEGEAKLGKRGRKKKE